MVRKIARNAVPVLAAGIVIYGMFLYAESFLPRVPLEERGWWLVLAFIVGGAPAAWWYAHDWDTHQPVMVLRGFGLFGWVMLLLGYKALDIDLFVAEMILFAVPIVVAVLTNGIETKGSMFAEPRYHESLRLEFILLALCSFLILLTWAAHLPESGKAFVTLIALVQAAGAMYPDYAQPNPLWRGDPESEPSIPRQAE